MRLGKIMRRSRLRKGLPFEIYSSELPFNHFYLEYPNGAIKLARKDHCTQAVQIIYELSITETEVLRKKYRI